MNKNIKIGLSIIPKAYEQLKNVCSSTRLGPSAVVDILLTGKPKEQFNIIIDLVHKEQDSTDSPNPEIGSEKG